MDTDVTGRGLLLRLETNGESALRFLRDLCTLGELHDLAQRWAGGPDAPSDGLHYVRDLSSGTGASTATITRIASSLNHGEGGYREALDRLKASAGTTPYPLGAEATC